MKRFSVLLVLLAVGLTIGCGGPKVKARPPHLTRGMQEIQKGTTAYQQGCYHQALDHFFKAHERFTVSDQLGGVAMSMNNIGNVYRFIGDPESADLFFDEAIGIYLALEDEAGAMQALSNKAALLIDLDKLDVAQETLRRAENLKGDKKSTAGLFNNKGVLLLKQNAYDQAEEMLNHGLDLASPEDLPEYATLNFSLGRLMLVTKRLDQALAYFNTALITDRQQGFHKGIADDLAALGSVYLAQTRYDTAATHFQRSIKIYALIEDKVRVDETLEQLELAAAKTGLDVRVTQLFVERWMDGKVLESPCH